MGTVPTSDGCSRTRRISIQKRRRHLCLRSQELEGSVFRAVKGSPQLLRRQKGISGRGATSGKPPCTSDHVHQDHAREGQKVQQPVAQGDSIPNRSLVVCCDSEAILQKWVDS